MTHHHHVISHRRIASYLISSHLISKRRHYSSHHFAQPVCFFWAKCKRIFVNVAHRAALHARVNARIPSASSCELPGVDLTLEAVRIERDRRLAGAAGTAVPATSVTAFCFTPYRTRLADLTDVQLRLRRVLFSAWR